MFTDSVSVRRARVRMLAGEPCLAIRPIIEGLRGKQAFDPERLRCVFCLKVGLKKLSTHLEDGRFSRLRAEEVGVCSPQMVHVNPKSKKRRCDDLRYVNAYLAHVNIRLDCNLY